MPRLPAAGSVPLLAEEEPSTQTKEEEAQTEHTDQTAGTEIINGYGE